MTAYLRDALEMAGLTDTGRMREHNEDALSFDADLGFAILADGMGGYNAGEVASGIAVEEVARSLREAIAGTPLHAEETGTVWPQSHRILRQAIEQANASVHATSLRDARFYGMGTTLVAGVFYDNRLLLAHVGDSRCYRWRAGQTTQLTRDHSLVQEQIDAGLLSPSEAQASEYKNLVTRAVGVEADVLVELQEYPVQTGDLFLFCSDGLSDMLDPATIGEILSDNMQGLMNAACSLIEHANEAGGLDNISVLLVRVRRDYHANPSLLQRLASWLK